MAEVIKVRGQVAPAATTETDLYTVPASTSAVVSSLTVCNRSGSNVTFRVAVVPGGGATGNANYLVYDLVIGKNDVNTYTLGLTLATTDKVKVYASTADLSFSLFGAEVS